MTTATGVQQLRGRILRLDPAWPEKVAHAYDVVCVDQSLDRGRIELDRLIRRHDRTWGIVPTGGEHPGDVVRGLDHVDPILARELLRPSEIASTIDFATAGLVPSGPPWQHLDLDAANRRTIDAIPHRDAVRQLWRVGEPYDNAIEWFNRLRLRIADFRTVATVQRTLRALFIRVAAVVASGVAFGWFWGQFAPVLYLPVFEGRLIAVVVGVLIGGLLNARAVVGLVRGLLVDQPPDAIVGDAARAVLGALRRANLVSGRLTNESIVVESLDDGTMTVAIRDRSAGEDSAIFARALDELFAPVDSPRYLIRRDDGRMPSLPLQLIWLPVRRMLRRGGGERPVYYPVPTILGVNRERADAFAADWRRWVGGGALVLARSPDGQRVLALARADRRTSAERVLTERWR